MLLNGQSDMLVIGSKPSRYGPFIPSTQCLNCIEEIGSIDLDHWPAHGHSGQL